ncbi:MAG: hypothetical protein PF549_02825 [Patescibacteria group bacterium]|jgi:hypothetical protein|nr:hypothetical protein [Patescibacteria group bacterium]
MIMRTVAVAGVAINIARDVISSATNYAKLFLHTSHVIEIPKK